MKNSYQSGSVILVEKKTGAEWRFRYRDNGVHRSEYLGTIQQFPDKADAERAADVRFRRHINANIECITVADLIQKFWRECPPERETTAHGYRSIFKRIEAEFGSLRIDAWLADTLRIENWLKALTVIGRHPKPGQKPKPVSNLYRGQVRNLIHLLAQKAMHWRHVALERNPIELIRLKNTSQRKREIVTVTPEQFAALLADPEMPELVKVMLQVMAALGLRISETRGLKWTDVDWEGKRLRVRRSVSLAIVTDTKSASSKRGLPLHDDVLDVLRSWKDSEPIIGGWIFGSARTGMPYDPSWLRSEYLQPAGERIGLSGLGWHSFRHTYRAMMRKAKVTPEEQKRLMGHSKLSTTMDVYGGDADVEEVRQANSKVVEMLARRTA